jgi:hypothetical protein
MHEQTRTASIFVTPDMKRRFSDAAAELGMDDQAYLDFLLLRSTLSDHDAERLDRHARIIWGRFGDDMTKLSQ